MAAGGAPGSPPGIGGGYPPGPLLGGVYGGGTWKPMLGGCAWPPPGP